MQTTRRHALPRRTGSLAGLVAVTATLATVGCGSSSTAPPASGPSGTYKGTFAGAHQSGVLTITFPAASASIRPASHARFSLVSVAEAASAPVSVSGTLAITDGTTIALTGTYNATGDPQLTLTGSGNTITGNATPSNGVFSGTIMFDNGTTGLWTVSPDGTVYCGTYSSTSGEGGGTWNVVVDKANVLTGVAYTGGGALQLLGTYTPSSMAVTVTYSVGTAAGTLNPTTGGGSGTYDASEANPPNAGTWTANTGGC